MMMMARTKMDICDLTMEFMWNLITYMFVEDRVQHFGTLSRGIHIGTLASIGKFKPIDK